jgi:hypothetical protein
MWFFEKTRNDVIRRGSWLGVVVVTGLLAARSAERASGAEPSARPATADGLPGPRPLHVPASLRRQRTRLELSGLVYARGLGRYLVVSDDTGAKENGTFHAPWLFAMTPAGEVEREPIVIDGIERLDDAESIAEGPQGTFLVATSASPKKSGKTPKERALLLQLELRGRTLHVVGRADLRSLEADGKPGGAFGPGVDPSARLDIEGIAYHDGDLFLGLKSPLSADGSALVLRLVEPLAALHEGQLRAGSLRPYAEVRLTARPAGIDVAEGISDLEFLPDGSLLLLANSPKGNASDGGGSLFRVEHPAEGVLNATLVRHFPGLKPEGVALAPSGHEIVVVFDRDRAAPVFLRMPVPG